MKLRTPPILALLVCITLISCKNEDTVEITNAEHAKLQNLNSLTEKANKALEDADAKLKETSELKATTDENLGRIEAENQTLAQSIETNKTTKAEADRSQAEALAKWDEVNKKADAVAEARKAVEALEKEVKAQTESNRLSGEDLVRRESKLAQDKTRLTEQEANLKRATEMALAEISINYSNLFHTINNNKPTPFMIAIMGWSNTKSLREIRSEIHQLREKPNANQGFGVFQESYIADSSPAAIFKNSDTESVKIADKYVVVMKGENVDKLLKSITEKSPGLRYVVEPIHTIAVEHYVTVERTAENFWGTDGAAREKLGPYRIPGNMTEINYGASEMSDLNLNRHWEFAFGAASGAQSSTLNSTSLGLMSQSGLFNASWPATTEDKNVAGKTVKQFLHGLFNDADEAFKKEGTENANKLISGMKIETYFWMPVSREYRSSFPISQDYFGEFDPSKSHHEVTANTQKFVFEHGNFRYYRLPITRTVSLVFPADKLDRLTEVRNIKEALQ